jgi:hypothetical protein
MIFPNFDLERTSQRVRATIPPTMMMKRTLVGIVTVAVALVACWLATRYIAPFDVDRAVAARMPVFAGNPGWKLEFEHHSPSPFHLDVYVMCQKTLYRSHVTWFFGWKRIGAVECIGAE